MAAIVNGEVAVLPEGGVTGLGKVKATSDGADPSHEGESTTASLKPLSDVTVIVEPPLDPCITEILIEDELIVKSGDGGTGLTTSVMGTEWLTDPAEASIVSGYVPTGVLVEVAIDTVVEKLGEFVMGVLGVAPAGSVPATVNVTGCVVPLARLSCTPQLAVSP